MSLGKAPSAAFDSQRTLATMPSFGWQHSRPAPPTSTDSRGSSMVVLPSRGTHISRATSSRGTRCNRAKGRHGGGGTPPPPRSGALEWVNLAWEPRDSVGCLAVGSGATPLGKEGSLHRPEAIKREVYSDSPCRVGARAKDARPDRQSTSEPEVTPLTSISASTFKKNNWNREMW